MYTQEIDYFHENTKLAGFVAYDENISGKRPVVLIAHAWAGRGPFVCEKAKALAKLGYVGFAMDVYGKGVFGNTDEECAQLMKPLAENRPLLRERLMAGFDAAKQLDVADSERIAAIGFCFGGLCVLDMARMGTDLRGVVSFHGILGVPDELKNNRIKAKILALHGHDDPMVPPEQVLAFETEMTKAQADWQMHVYGNTMHAFTNPQASNRSFGTVYNKTADQRSWKAMQNFLEEIFYASST